jgi:putative peptidoglycan lipid II flippase
VLDAGFYRFGIWGIPLSTSLVNIAGTVALVVLLQRELGRLELRETLDTVLRVTVAGCALGLVSFGVWRGLNSALGDSFVAALVGVLAALGAGLGIYLVFARLLRIRELEALLSLRSRLRRA